MNEYSADALRCIHWDDFLTMQPGPIARNLLGITEIHRVNNGGVYSPSDGSACALSAYRACPSDTIPSTARRLLNYSPCILIRKYRWVEHGLPGI